MSFFFEIVELSNGDVALRHSENIDGEVLLSIHFSDVAKASLNAHHLEVARAMMEAAVHKVGELSGLDVERDDLQTPSYQTQLH